MGNRSKDSNGYLTVRNCPLSREGVFDYSAAQLGLDGDPNRIIKVYRPLRAITDPRYIESLKEIPIIDDHTHLSGDNDEFVAPEEKGVHGITTGNVEYIAPWVCGDIKVFSRELQRSIDSGKRDLSIGFSCDFIEKPGIFQGQAYEFEQDGMIANHLALVKDARILGARVMDGLVFDHLCFETVPTKKETNMPKRKAVGDTAVKQLLALIPALEEYLREEATEPAHQSGKVGDSGEEFGQQQEEKPASDDASGNPSENMPPESTGKEPTSLENTPSETEQVRSLLQQVLEKLGGTPAVADEEGNQPPEGMPSADNNAPENLQAGGEEEVKGVKDDCNLFKAGDGSASTGEASKGIAADSPDESGGQSGVVPGSTAADEGPDESGGQAKVLTGDAALKQFYRDQKEKIVLADRLSEVVGVFDHSEMTHQETARYGVQKLNIKCADGAEVAAVNAYLQGIEESKARQAAAVKTIASDSASGNKSGCQSMDDYLKGTK